MRRAALLLCVFLLAPAAAQAQKYDLFAGYSFARFEQLGGDENTSGWEASLAYKFTPYVAVVGDVTGNYGTLFQKSMNAHNYYIGGQIMLPSRYSPFVHVLLGGMRVSIPGVAHTAFSTEWGGGLDIRVNHYLSVRAIEADVVTGTAKSLTSEDGHITAGIVFHF